MLKKWIAGSMAMLLVGSVMLSACSNGGEPAATSSQDNTEEAAPITYEIFLNNAAPNYPEDGGEAKALLLEGFEKHGASNVDYKVTMASGQEYTTKLNSLAAANDLPDLFQITSELIDMFYSQGLLMDVTEYLEASPNILSSIQPKDLEAVKIDGRIYAWPGGQYERENSPYNAPTTGCMLYRSDWAEKLGIDPPETLDEFYEMLVAFTKEDPDGNGKDDTYGMGGNKNLTYGGFPMVFGAYGVNPNFFHLRDGKLVKGYLLPETKEAIGVLAQWYSEGLIDPDFLVTEETATMEKFIGNKIGTVGSDYFRLNPTNPDYTGFYQANPEGKFDVLYPVTGPEGKSGWPETLSAYSDMRAVSAKCEDPERLFKMIDWTADPSEDGGFNFITYGVEGEHYTYDEETNHIELSWGTDEQHAYGISHPLQWHKLIDRRWMLPEIIDVAVQVGTETIPNDYPKHLPIMDEYPELSQLFEQYFTKIITGALPLDAYDDFMEEYLAKGGQKIQDAVNEDYQKMQAAENAG